MAAGIKGINIQVASVIFLIVLCAQAFTSLLLRIPSISSLVHSSHHTAVTSKRCEHALVYNKPGKTGSSTILKAIREWAAAENRTVHYCSSFIRFNKVVLPECIPEDKSGCSVVAMHLEMNANVRSILQERIGDFKLLTSTRAPEKRIISAALQWHLIRSAKAAEDPEIVRSFLREFNPWTLYNYHAGKAKEGECPISKTQERLIYDLVSNYDVVIDVDFPEQSNAILKANNLFQLSAESRQNIRGASDLELDSETSALLKNVSCVEESMHNVLRMRMAYLYGLARKKPCLRQLRVPKPCF